MLISEIITINVNKANRKYYLNLGYDVKIGDSIEVYYKKIQRKSSQLIDVLCDYCGVEKNPTFKSYMDSIEKSGTYACRSCYSKKLKDIFLKKWGVENPSQLDSVKEKKKETYIKNYNVEHYSKTDEYKEKIKSTSLEKWGDDHYSKTDEYKEKIKSTSLENWGVESPFSTKEVKDKIKETNKKRWGFENPFQSEDVKDKIKKTNLERWGVEYVFQSDYIKDKIRKTNFEKFGNDHYIKSEEYFNNTIIGSDIDHIEYIGDSIHLFKCDVGHNYEVNIDNYYNRKKSNVNICTICNPIGDFKSIKENDLFDFIKSQYSGNIIQSYRDGLEIDIYLPELKLGFEFNGLYWHSDKLKDRNYHKEKTNYFKDRDIRIIHVWEDDWDFKNNIIKSQISNLIGNSKNKIFARKCQIKEMSNCTKFLNDNHIQGVDRSKIKIGLFYECDLVSVMTFNKLEGREIMKNGEWNLSRFCNKLETSVVGGASKLLNYFIKTYLPKRIISYADLDWSRGNLYYKLGFKLISESKPDYKYLINNKRKNKQNFKKKNLKIDNSDISERMYMESKNINKIWDCGKIKFEIIF